jgi:hypothetical protein
VSRLGSSVRPRAPFTAMCACEASGFRIDPDQGAVRPSCIGRHGLACRSARPRRVIIVCSSVALLGLRLLVAAALCSLVVLPAAAHPGHGHDRPAIGTLVAFDAPVDRIAHQDARQGEETVTASAVEAFALAACLCQRGGSFMSCGFGTTCACGSCGHGGALAASYSADPLLCANGKVVALRQQLLAGLDPTPDDRPPRL